MIHQSDELLCVYGFFKVEIEAEIEITSRNRSGLQLGDVDSAGIDYDRGYFDGGKRLLAPEDVSCGLFPFWHAEWN